MLQRTAVRTLTLGMQFCKTGMSSGKLELKEITLEKKMQVKRPNEYMQPLYINRKKKKLLWTGQESYRHLDSQICCLKP